MERTTTREAGRSGRFLLLRNGRLSAFLALAWLLLSHSLAWGQTNIFVGLPFQITASQTPEEKEREQIKSNTVALLNAENYTELEVLAARLRASKEQWSNGHWKLAYVYCSLVCSDEDSEQTWKNRHSALKKWVAVRTNSVTAKVALAYFTVDYAWQARGGGWASEVTEQGWRLFEERLKQAVGILDDVKKLKESCPVAWTVRMQAALGLNTEKEEFDSIFKAAVLSWPDYDAYYFRRAMYLLPRWHGEEGEWENDLAKSADKLGTERGNVVYAQVVSCIQQCVNFTNIFKQNSLSWTRVNQGFETIIKRFPDSLSAKNEAAHLAVLARDKEAAQKYFLQTEGHVDLSVWKSANDYVRFARWTF